MMANGKMVYQSSYDEQILLCVLHLIKHTKIHYTIEDVKYITNVHKHIYVCKVYDDWRYNSTCVGGGNHILRCRYHIQLFLRGRRNSTITPPRSCHIGTRTWYSVNVYTDEDLKWDNPPLVDCLSIHLSATFPLKIR
jgi:hypothetical protein